MENKCDCYRCTGIVPDYATEVEKQLENYGIELSSIDQERMAEDCSYNEDIEAVEGEVIKLKNMLEKLPTVEDFAKEFIKVLGEWLSEQEMGHIKVTVIDNAHDYCDANMAVLKAFTNLTGIKEDDILLYPEFFHQLINQTWDKAQEML